jgi:hypothetical protein
MLSGCCILPFFLVPSVTRSCSRLECSRLEASGGRSWRRQASSAVRPLPLSPSRTLPLFASHPRGREGGRYLYWGKYSIPEEGEEGRGWGLCCGQKEGPPPPFLLLLLLLRYGVIFLINSLSLPAQRCDIRNLYDSAKTHSL